MIKSLILTNFRSHENTELAFSPQVNVIVGKSDHGKSNIIRALNWIVTNRPLGENVVQYGKEETVAQIIIEDNKKEIGVTRRKKKNKNEYILSTDEENISFEAFGTVPPEPILTALNLSDVNIQKQKEQYFLIFDSPGQVATYIRSITKLDKVDEVVKLLASKIRLKTGQVNNYQIELKEAKKKLAEISKIDLDDFEKKINSIHLLIEANEQLCREQNELINFLKELEKVEKSIVCFPVNINQILQSCDSQSKLYEDLLDKETNLTVLLVSLEKVQKIILPENIEGFSNVNAIILKYNNMYKEVEELNLLVEKLKKVGERIFNLDNQLQVSKESEKKLMNQLDICPSCGTKLSEESRKYLVNRR